MAKKKVNMKVVKAKALAKAASKQSNLSAFEEKFCQLFATEREFFCNGVQSYIEAFDLKPTQYGSAATKACTLLKKVDIQKRIEELVELDALNDATVDKQLAKVIVQDYDLSAKVAGVREYNKLKSRITQKIAHTFENDPTSEADIDALLAEGEAFFKKKKLPAKK